MNCDMASLIVKMKLCVMRSDEFTCDDRGSALELLDELNSKSDEKPESSGNPESAGNAGSASGEAKDPVGVTFDSSCYPGNQVSDENMSRASGEDPFQIGATYSRRNDESLCPPSVTDVLRPAQDILPSAGDAVCSSEDVSGNIDSRIAKYRGLCELSRAYLKLLSDAYTDRYTFCYVHGLRDSDEMMKRAEDLRESIRKAEQDIDS